MPNQIVRINFKDLSNEAHVELHESVDSRFVKHTPASLGVAAQYADYKPLLGTEISLLNLIRRSEYTRSIAQQDRERNLLLRGLTNAVKSNLYYFDPDKQDAARKLQSILHHYGSFARRPLDQKTAAIDDLLRELATPDHAALITTLALGDWLTHLDTTNQTFKTLMQERYHETAQRPTTRMKTTRAAVDKAFRALLARIEALVAVNGLTDYEAIIRELNAILGRYKNLLAQQRGRSRRGIKKEELIMNNEGLVASEATEVPESPESSAFL
jgi:hypothetical protein